jgi:hypothetical protein
VVLPKLILSHLPHFSSKSASPVPGKSKSSQGHFTFGAQPIWPEQGITFLNKAGVTLSCRGSKKIPASIPGNHLNSIWIGRHYPVLGPTIVHVGALGCLVFVCQLQHGSDRWGPIGSTMHSTFLFFIFLVYCMLREDKVLSQCWLRMLWVFGSTNGPLFCK